MRNNLLLFCLLFSCNFLFAQSLQQCIQLTLKHHYGILIQKNKAQIAQNNNTYGNAGFLPSVDVLANHQQNINTSEQVFFTGETRFGEGAKNTFTNLQLVLNWTVFDGFKMFAEKSKLDALAQIGEWETRYQIEQTISDLILLYSQLQFEGQQLENLNKVLEISEYRLQLESKRKDVRSGNILAYQQALVDLQNDKITYLNQQQIVNDLSAQINTLMHQNPQNSLDIDKPATVLVNFNLDSVLVNVQSNNFYFKETQLQELVAEKDIAIAKALKYPTINLFSGYAYNNNINEIGFIQKNLNFGNNVGINVRMNLFNGNKNTVQIKNAKLNHQNSLHQTAFLQQELNNQGVILVLQHQNLQKQYELALENEKLAKNMLETADTQFKLGAINGYEYRLSALSVLQSLQKSAQIYFQLLVVQTHIHRLSGRIITEYM